MFTQTILIVEDHKDGRDMLIEYFLASGYLAIGFGDPRSAVTFCRETAPAIVLADLSLPSLHAACGLISAIKHCGSGAPPYVIGLNGWGFSEQAASALAAGCSVVISKPLDLDLLRAAVTIGMAANIGGCSAA